MREIGWQRQRLEKSEPNPEDSVAASDCRGRAKHYCHVMTLIIARVIDPLLLVLLEPGIEIRRSLDVALVLVLYNTIIHNTLGFVKIVHYYARNRAWIRPATRFKAAMCC